MVYRLVDEDRKSVSELLADELPEVGSTIRAWAQNVDSNSVPSGSILVTPL
jgi:hypothetical protein